MFFDYHYKKLCTLKIIAITVPPQLIFFGLFGL